MLADERFVRARARARDVSAAAAGNGAAIGVAGAIQEHAGSGAVRDLELLAGRGCAGGAAFLRDCGRAAVCGAERSDPGGTGERGAGGRARCVWGVSGAASAAGVAQAIMG